MSALEGRFRPKQHEQSGHICGRRMGLAQTDFRSARDRRRAPAESLIIRFPPSHARLRTGLRRGSWRIAVVTLAAGAGSPRDSGAVGEKRFTRFQARRTPPDFRETPRHNPPPFASGGECNSDLFTTST